MFRHLRRSLAFGSVGFGMLLLTVLTASPAAAATPFTQVGCANGNFACLRAQHVVFVPRVVYRPIYAPSYFAAPRYVAAPTPLGCPTGMYTGMMPGTMVSPAMMPMMPGMPMSFPSGY